VANAKAFEANITSADLTTLIAETETAIVAAEAAAETERAKALDPLTSPDPVKARQVMDNAGTVRRARYLPTPSGALQC